MGIPNQSPKRNKLFLLLAWIFAALFVISTVGVIFSFFPTRKLLNPDFYKQALEDINIYQRLPESIAQQLASNFTQRDADANLAENSPVYLLLLDQQEWEAILIDLINPVWLQTQTENIIDQFFDILLISPDPINTPIEISLSEVKSRLAGPEGIQAFNLILNAQEACSFDQLMGLLQLGLGMEASIDTLLCRPPDYIISELNPVVGSFLEAAVAQLPNQVSFILPAAILQSSADGNSAESNQGALPLPIQTLRRTNALISWSPLIPIGLIILMTIFAVRSLRDFFLWWGGTFLTAGGISLILSLIFFPTMNWALSRFMPGSPSEFGLTTVLLELGLVELSRQLANSLVISVVIPAGLLALVGLMLLLGAYLLPQSAPATEVLQNENASPTEDADRG